jgi:hypothetical protein
VASQKVLENSSLLMLKLATKHARELSVHFGSCLFHLSLSLAAWIQGQFNLDPHGSAWDPQWIRMDPEMMSSMGVWETLVLR